VDGFGHISVRHDQSPAHFLPSCNRAPGLVSPGDILMYDLNGDLAAPSDKRSYLERFIHSEIYKARPDVVSVVHSHLPSVISCGATGQRQRPIFHMSGFLGSGSALFEIRDGAGNTDLLIRDSGHGSTTVAPSIDVAVYRAIYADVQKVLAEPAIQQNLSNAGVEPFAGSGGDLAKLIKSDLARYAQLAKSANIKAE
jgi:ribulose-5-phosphate 4-epimerase/fuculose-1-phosphate aldolase